MKLSKATVYAIRFAIYIALAQEEPPQSTRRIAAALDLPFPFLNKICQLLTRKGILEARRGARGGVRLARPAADISLLDIMDAVEGSDQLHRCVLDLPGCGMQTPCPVHDDWCDIQARIRAFMSGKSLELLAQKARTEGLRLKDLAE